MFSEKQLGYGSALDGLTAGYVSPAVAGTAIAKRALFQINSVAPLPDQGAAGVAVATAARRRVQEYSRWDRAGRGCGQWERVALHPGLRHHKYIICACDDAQHLLLHRGGERLLRRPGQFHVGRLRRGVARRDHGDEQPPRRGQRGLRRRVSEIHKDSISSQTWWALGTRNRGEVISSDSY